MRAEMGTRWLEEVFLAVSDAQRDVQLVTEYLELTGVPPQFATTLAMIAKAKAIRQLRQNLLIKHNLR